MKAGIRILVTGTRGKSGIVRGLQQVLSRLKIQAWGKVTGVMPLSLGPGESMEIGRASGAHVEEMRWWLRSLPLSAEAVVLENNAVTPELQPLAARWLDPTLTIWTNARRDHEDLWGWDEEAPLYVLARGVPRGAKVLCGFDVASSATAQRLLEGKGCEVLPAGNGLFDPVAISKVFIREACRLHGIEGPRLEKALEEVGPAFTDFSVHRLDEEGRLLAAAFSANDSESTRNLWKSLRWDGRETSLWLHNRRDRRTRITALRDFVLEREWKEILLTGPYPIGAGFQFTYLGFPDIQTISGQLGKKTFGFGNIAGLPLELLKLLAASMKDQEAGTRSRGVAL
jgi:hypothetical protein